jgi:hypothetical protein
MPTRVELESVEYSDQERFLLLVSSGARDERAYPRPSKPLRRVGS